MTDKPTFPAAEADLLTITEVAELLRMPVATLRYKRHDRSGPRSFRLGRRVLYRRSDVIDYIEMHYNNDGPHAA